MFRRIRAWIEAQLRWNGDHRRTWAGVVVPGPDGLSQFQHETETAIRAALQDRGFEMGRREVVRPVGGVEAYIVAEVPDLDAQVWIYCDQTDIVTSTSQLRLEQWDARTPEEHRAKVVEFLRSL